MATKPKQTDEPDNVVSLRKARARQAEAKAQAQTQTGKTASDRAAPGKRMPALLIFLAMLAVLVAYKFLAK